MIDLHPSIQNLYHTIKAYGNAQNAIPKPIGYDAMNNPVFIPTQDAHVPQPIGFDAANRPIFKPEDIPLINQMITGITPEAPKPYTGMFSATSGPTQDQIEKFGLDQASASGIPLGPLAQKISQGLLGLKTGGKPFWTLDMLPKSQSVSPGLLSTPSSHAANNFVNNILDAREASLKPGSTGYWDELAKAGLLDDASTDTVPQKGKK